MFVQMDTVFSHHIMSLSGISEKVRMGSCVNAGPEERQGMLRHADRIVVADNDLKPSFQIARLEKEVAAFVSFQVVLREQVAQRAVMVGAGLR